MTRRWSLICDDMRDALARMPECSVDAVITDPPYELGSTGRAWDSTGIAFDPDTWEAVWRVLKPGGHMLAFGGTRTNHRIACAIEDAGFEIRDSLAWIYGTGFPKSLNVSKAIDDDAGAVREVIGQAANYGASRAADGKVGFGDFAGEWEITAPATGDAKKWDGWGTGLRPSIEPITLARKPLDGRVVDNVLRYGTGALNIDGGRIGETKRVPGGVSRTATGGAFLATLRHETGEESGHNPNIGRWPANVVLDEAAAALLDQQSPGASRFFYVVKPDRNERDAGCEALPLVGGHDAVARKEGSAGVNNPRAGAGRTSGARNTHPTVKPIDLGRYLAKLIAPSGGRVLDCFAGSASLLIGAMLEGFEVVGVEMETPHAVIAHERLRYWSTRSLAPAAKARPRRAADHTPDLFPSSEVTP